MPPYLSARRCWAGLASTKPSDGGPGGGPTGAGGSGASAPTSTGSGSSAATVRPTRLRVPNASSAAYANIARVSAAIDPYTKPLLSSAAVCWFTASPRVRSARSVRVRLPAPAPPAGRPRRPAHLPRPWPGPPTATSVRPPSAPVARTQIRRRRTNSDSISPASAASAPTSAGSWPGSCATEKVAYCSSPSNVMEPRPSGSCQESPGRITSPSTWVIREVSSRYTDCGVPVSRPRSPLKRVSSSSGLSGAGNVDWPPSTGSMRAVGRNSARNPIWVGLASGTLMTPSERKWLSRGRNGTADDSTTRPCPSRTVTCGAYPWPMRNDLRAADGQRLVDLRR